jgi:precorrin-2 dehydrogenase / sirohydrochlorin ferrochelatase
VNFRFPVFLDLSGKKCLVIGEGYEVAGKVHALVDASAQVLYVNPQAEPAIEALAAAGLIHWEKRAFIPEDLDELFLVISDLEDNSQIFRMAEERRILCNCVDDPEYCRFSFGSIHRRGELTIAISTNGWAPAVAVRLKEKFQREIGPEYTDFLQLLKESRPRITSQVADFGARRELWYRIVDSEVLALLSRGEKEAAATMLQHMIDSAVGDAGTA